MPDVCLFCRLDLSGAPGQRNREHIIPASLGGDRWRKTWMICRACNSRFGSDVDRVADLPILIALRREAGLVTERDLPVEYFDDYVESSLQGRLKGDGSLQPDKLVHAIGDDQLIFAWSREEVERKALEIAEKRRKRGRPVEIGEFFERPLRPVSIRLPDRYATQADLKPLLLREAAKVAIEYIAEVSGANVALSPALDGVRKCAYQGTPLDAARMGYRREQGYHLPRLGLQLWTSARLPTDDELRALPPLNELQHTMRVLKDQGSAFFELNLFNWYLVQVPISDDLPVSWGRLDYIDFTRPRTGTRWS